MLDQSEVALEFCVFPFSTEVLLKRASRPMSFLMISVDAQARDRLTSSILG